MKSNPQHESDPRIVYADIIDLPHWESPIRPKMSLYNRAAQFSPFAALSGYEDIIREEARETGSWIEPGEYRKEKIDRMLNIITEAAASMQKPVVRITYFVPDSKKDGGEYITTEKTVRKIDPVHRKLILMSTEGNGKQEIEFSRITNIDLI